MIDHEPAIVSFGHLDALIYLRDAQDRGRRLAAKPSGVYIGVADMIFG